MRVALIHFHLNTGGVTTVLRQQAEILMARGHDVLIICGEKPMARWPVPMSIVPGLAYDTASPHAAPGVSETTDAILATLRRQWPGGRPDVIHVHNPTLAKNRRLQAVIKQLQQTGLALLCQIHDFAEDGRPNAYFQEPYLSDCHYAVVNGRDRRILIACGLTENGVHHLPNAVRPWSLQEQRPTRANGHVLYPVRAIRRKNIGESILLQHCAFPGSPLIITLPPTSPSDATSYRMWRRYAADRGLPVVFGAGIQGDFRQLMNEARYVITTSINEGFGFSFLEAWTAGKALWGRLLPDICQDFIRFGIRLEHLYPQLGIPLAWIAVDDFRRQWQTVRWHAAAHFGMKIDERKIKSDWSSITKNGVIDFGLLSEPFQRQVLDHLLSDSDTSRRLLETNPALKDFGSQRRIMDALDHNRDAISAHFSMKDYEKRLVKLYENVCNRPVRQHIDKAALFWAFMAAEHFSLLKWCGFEDECDPQTTDHSLS